LALELARKVLIPHGCWLDFPRIIRLCGTNFLGDRAFLLRPFGAGRTIALVPAASPIPPSART
jgi:hypothetical protein